MPFNRFRFRFNNCLYNVRNYPEHNEALNARMMVQVYFFFLGVGYNNESILKCVLIKIHSIQPLILNAFQASLKGDSLNTAHRKRKCFSLNRESDAFNSSACVVSGLFFSKVSPCSLIIKWFCGGKAGWNDEAIFIKTESNAFCPDQKRPRSDIIKSVDKKDAKMLCPLPHQNLSLYS